MASQILLVDDELPVLNALKRVLRGEGYEILVAQTAQEALTVLSQAEVAVIVCDYGLGSMTGAEVLAEAVETCPNTVRIMLTASNELKTAQDAINQGRISQFLLKPWEDDHLRIVVREAVRHFQMEQEIRLLNDETKRQRDELETWNQRLEEQVRERTAELHAAYEDTLNALVVALDRREHATAGHSRRVAAYCLYLALELGIPDNELENVYRGALLHDIGKIGVPDAVLLKPGKLTAHERRLIEQHIPIGCELLEEIGYLTPALSIPRYHDERHDGLGYAEGLAGDSIPMEAKAFAIIDTYDALRCERPYKAEMAHDRACHIVADPSGGQFDPAIVPVFLDIPEAVWQQLAARTETAKRFDDVLAVCKSVRSQMAQAVATG